MTATVSSPDYKAAIGTLPPAYATALRMRDAGEDAASIASALGIGVNALPMLLEIAGLKLQAALSE